MHILNSSLVAGQSRFTDNPHLWKYSTGKYYKVHFYSLCGNNLSSCYSRIPQRCNVMRECVWQGETEGKRERETETRESELFKSLSS